MRGLVLYGSYARGEQTSDSDIDLMVLLTGPVHFNADLDEVVTALYPLQLATESPIHAIPVDVQTFERGEYAIYRHAKEEGIFV